MSAFRIKKKKKSSFVDEVSFMFAPIPPHLFFLIHPPLFGGRMHGFFTYFFPLLLEYLFVDLYLIKIHTFGEMSL